jgi:hypothetical protein
LAGLKFLTSIALLPFYSPILINSLLCGINLHFGRQAAALSLALSYQFSTVTAMASQVGELKEQGAEEAARQQNSNAASEDAERKIVEESKKAGYQAYQFDPNATPEQKAAQARTVGVWQPTYI